MGEMGSLFEAYLMAFFNVIEIDQPVASICSLQYFILSLVFYSTEV